MGRPRKLPIAAPPKLRVARFERLKSGLSVQAIEERTGIPKSLLSEFQRGTKALNAADLAALARVYAYVDPNALTLEAANRQGGRWRYF